MLKQNKIAVFFDCENVSAKYIEEILDRLSEYGEVMISRAYCDWSNNEYQVWSDALNRYGLEAIHVQPNTVRKNAADIKIVIDVMKTICSSKVDTIAIVSSDSDFTSLVREIKANSFNTIGFGEQKTPESLRNIYSNFIELPTKHTVNKNDEQPLIEIKKIIDEHQDEDGYINVAQIGTFLGNKKNIGSPKEYGAKTWGDYIKNRPDMFEVKSVGRRQSTLVVKNAA